MKQLTNTKRLLDTMLSDGRLENYVLLVGFGNDEWELTSEKCDTDTYFDAASVGKIFPTTALILRLVGEGRLSLDDTIDKFFDNVPEDRRGITVKHLLTHTSGMLRGVYPDNVAERGRESVIEFIFSLPLAYETGTHFAYCCDGMMLLGLIAEKLLGTDLETALKKYVLSPLGRSRSTYEIPCDKNAVNCNHLPEVTDIRRDDDNVKKLRGIPAGNGGVFITPGDLRAFVKAVMARDERLYSREMYDASEKNLTSGLPTLDKFRGCQNHGLGYEYINENQPQACELFPEGSIGHTGWTGQSFMLCRDIGLYVILMTDAARCMAKLGRHIDEGVHEMRTLVHRAIKMDLGL